MESPKKEVKNKDRALEESSIKRLNTGESTPKGDS